MAGYTGFSSFKTSHPIFYTARFIRDALVQLTLDPSVTLIEPLLISLDDLPEAVRSGIIVQRDGVRIAVGFVDTYLDIQEAPQHQFDGLPTVFIAREQVLAEPRCSIARMIWACRKTLVSPGNRVRILHSLSQSCDGLSLVDLGNVVSGPEDPIDAILALACEGHIAVNISAAVTPETIVRRMRRDV
jgi:hypothetical protein